MIINLVKTIIGELPLEYEFIYYIVSSIAAFLLLSIPAIPLIAIFRPMLGGRR